MKCEKCEAETINSPCGNCVFMSQMKAMSGNDDKSEALESALRLAINAPSEEQAERASELAESIAVGMNPDAVQEVKDRIEKSEVHAKRFDEIAKFVNNISNYDLSLLLGMVAERICVFDPATSTLHNLDTRGDDLSPVCLNGASVQLNLE